MMKTKRLAIIFALCCTMIFATVFGLTAVFAEEETETSSETAFSLEDDFTIATSEDITVEDDATAKNTIVKAQYLTTKEGDGGVHLQISTDFSTRELTEGFLVYKLVAGENYGFKTLNLDVNAKRIANYGDGEIKVSAYAADTLDGTYTQIGETTTATGNALTSLSYNFTEYAKGKAVIYAKFQISYNNAVPSYGHDWTQIRSLKFTGEKKFAPAPKPFSFEDDFTVATSEAITVENDATAKNAVVEAQHLVTRNGDGGMHLQISTDFSTRELTEGFLVYKLVAGDNYGFKTLNLEVNARRIANYGDGEIKVSAYATDTLDGTYTQIGETTTATGNALTSLSYNFTEYAAGKAVVYAKFQISYNNAVPGYGHDWTQIKSLKFTGETELVPVAVADKVFDYTSYATGSTMYDCEENTLILRKADDHDTVYLQTSTEGNIKSGYIVYKFTAENGGEFATMKIIAEGRFMHAISAANGFTSYKVEVKADDGEYVKVVDKSYEGNEANPVEKEEDSLSSAVSGAQVVYVKITLTDGTNVGFAHDWVRLAKVTFSMTEKFEPIDEDGRRVSYAKEGNEIGKIPSDDKIYKAGDKVILANNLFVKTGYEFAGWVSGADGKTYAPGDEYVMTDEDTVFTASWKAIDYTVSYTVGLEEDQYTGELPANETKNIGDELILPQNPITAEGYKFEGWTINYVIYQPGDKYVIGSSDVQIGMKWFKEDYDGFAIDLSLEKYDYMGEFAASFINDESFCALDVAYEVYHLDHRTNDEGTMNIIQIPQGSSTSYGFFTYKLLAGENKAFTDLLVKFSGRVAVYLSDEYSAKIEVLGSYDYNEWTLLKTFEATGNPATDYSADVSSFANGKEALFIKFAFTINNFPGFGAEWVAISAVEISGVAEAAKVTVTYYDGETKLEEASVSKGAAYTAIAGTAKEGYTFLGWYKDAALTEKFEDGTVLNENVSLYAKYEQNGTSGENTGDNTDGCGGCDGSVTGLGLICSFIVLAGSRFMLRKKEN